MENESNIERNARIGQTSQELAERNSLRRIGFYAVLTSLLFAVSMQMIWPKAAIPAGFVGFLGGVGIAILIDQKMKREDITRKSQPAIDLANERQRERNSQLEAAKANGDLDRWKK
ncbi:MAG: hypothetical protein AAGA12_08855 [Pseudomonadota bacterium]